MGMSDFYIRVVKALDEIGAPYIIVGAYGGSVFGIARSTSDYNVNLDEVTKEAEHIGQESLEIWNKTLAKAKAEIEKGDTPRKW